MLRLILDWFGVNKSIFRKLLLSYMVTVLLGLGALGLSMSVLAKNYIYDGTKEELLRKAKKVNLAIQTSQTNPWNEDQTQSILAFLDETFDTRIWVFDQSGHIIATSTRDEVFIGKSVASQIVEQVMRGQNVVQNLAFAGLTKPMVSVVVPWGQKDKIFGGIVLHAPVEGIEETVGNMRVMILWATLLGILLSTAMVSYLSWTISRPLKRMDMVALEIEKGNYEQRIEVTSEDEIGDLARSMNRMAATLAHVEAERAELDKVRQDFIANVSHELRTPLTAMQGFLEALQDGLVQDGASRQKYYDVMYKETLHMSRLVDDLLELVRLTKHEFNLVKQPVNMEALLNRLAFTFTAETEKRGLALRLALDLPLPAVMGDAGRIEQIFVNLLGNALKFTERGYIELAARAEKGGVEVTVTDTGIGIAEADIPHVWDRFFKVDRVRSRSETGTGLGLAIVQELVGLHAGVITVQSKLGEGTVFTVWLPGSEEQT